MYKMKGFSEMRERVSRDILILALVVVYLLGFFFFVYERNALKDYSTGATLEVNGTEVFERKVDLPSLRPGEDFEYKVKFKSRAADDYDIGIEFKEVGESTLKDFVNVEICYGEEVYVHTLCEMLDENKKVNFVCALGEEPAQITIRFSMPEEVGNEAQGTVADFDVLLSTNIVK